MEIDRKLLSRAASLLSEARDGVERVRHKATIDEGPADEEVLESLVVITNDIDRIIATLDKLTKED